MQSGAGQRRWTKALDKGAGQRLGEMVRGLVSLLVVALVASAAIVVSPRSFERVLPVALIERLEIIGLPFASGAAEARSGDSPSDYLDDLPEGLVANGPIAAAKGNVPVFIAEVIASHKPPDPRDIPTEITTIRPIMGCRLTPPLDGTLLGHVVAGQNAHQLGLSTYNDGDLAASVQAFVDAYRIADAPDLAAPSVPEGLAFQSYDVVVTETAVPAYLVLQTGSGNRIWNIHVAPGARVERVVLLGGGQVGVANLDPVVPVEVILDSGLLACGIAPAHALNPAHAMTAAALSGTVGAAARLAEHGVAVDAYGLWFRDTFGVLAEPSRAGFDVGTISVVGPVPDPKEPLAVFAPIAQSKVRTTQDSFFEIAGQVADGEDFAARVRAIATSFAFGDLANLRQGGKY